MIYKAPKKKLDWEILAFTGLYYTNELQCVFFNESAKNDQSCNKIRILLGMIWVEIG